MVSLIHDVDTGHSEMIHDAQMDYCGTRLATCSFDKTVKVFSVEKNFHTHLATLKGHTGPVWQVAWAHPLFGSILASCSYDRKVIVWKEIEGKWKNSFEYSDHDSSVNSISWAPNEYGLILVCGSSDGSVSILINECDEVWAAKKIHNAHTIGCNAVSWAPLSAQIAYESVNEPGCCDSSAFKRFVTGGCDNLVKIWKYIEKDDAWCEEDKLEAHSNWIRDVVWAPSTDFGLGVIASCSQDKRVIIWNKTKETKWIPKILHTFDDVVWHVSFSVTGSVLAVSGGDNEVSLWKSVNGHQWVRFDNVNEEHDDKD